MIRDKALVAIERAVPEDAESILNLKRDAWLASYVDDEQGVTSEDILKKMGDISIGAENWRRGIASETGGGDRVTFVARLNGKVVGFTAPCTEDGQRRVGAMYVAPDMQGQGIGGKLLKKALEWHGVGNDVYVQVVSYNSSAIGFYEHFGFEKTGKEFPAEFDEVQGIKLLPQFEMVHLSYAD
jgi:GNAT superfamily N-acetyltransferase